MQSAYQYNLVTNNNYNKYKITYISGENALGMHELCLGRETSRNNVT